MLLCLCLSKANRVGAPEQCPAAVFADRYSSGLVKENVRIEVCDLGGPVVEVVSCQGRLVVSPLPFVWPGDFHCECRAFSRRNDDKVAWLHFLEEAPEAGAARGVRCLAGGSDGGWLA